MNTLAFDIENILHRGEINNLFAQIYKKVKIFTEDEIMNMLDMVNGWLMDFSNIPAKEAIVAEYEDWCVLDKNKKPEEYNNKLYNKLKSLDELSALLLCKILEYSWSTGDCITTATELLKQ
jgi:hypothetical protein